MKRKIRMGMVGGGPGAFIGSIHRIAAIMDGHIELVCGAFSSNPEKSADAGKELYLDPKRVYSTCHQMIEQELALAPDVRMDFVAIVTPNHLHFEPAKLALENGFHVVCDKPLALNLEEAIALEKVVNSTDKLFALTHTYSGYPMIKEAKYLISTGVIGKVKKVMVEYPQSWLAKPIEFTGHKQADWRTDPKKAGISCCMGDIGTHVWHLAEYVTGLKIEEVAADLSTFVEGRLLDDDGSVLLRFQGGAKGILTASQISTGEENNVRIKVYGEKAGLEWYQEECNTLRIKWLDKPLEIRRTGGIGASPFSNFNTRVPAGHPEGYLEAFANIYRNFAFTLQSILSNEAPKAEYLDFPTVSEGVRGMAFINAVVKSSKENAQWTKLEV
ncbi:MAG: gfo/Idh/MocA family oxidoreductase [Cytophagales bacterium]|nr:MAG: gfo/Idh/MocA family oxidoreductase [Cytophagales bacterium]